MRLDESTNEFDGGFGTVPGLTWLPWVGQRFAERSLQKRLLVVGESHYYNGKTAEERRANCEKWRIFPQYTRDVVSESLVNYAWTTRTLDTIHRVLFKTTNIDRRRLWATCAYYNIVQRMMDYCHEGGPERPTWEDYLQGWRVFAEVVKIIRPSHCFFIGVTAANSFSHWLSTQTAFAGSILMTRKIGGTWARAGHLQKDEKRTQLIFVKHLGLPLCWIQWHNYLQAQHNDFMSWLSAENYLYERPTSEA